jgi:hypothetical protein
MGSIGSMFGGGGGDIDIPTLSATPIYAGGIGSDILTDVATSGYVHEMYPAAFNENSDPVRRAIYQQSLDRKAAADGIKQSYLDQAGRFRESIPQFQELFGGYSDRYDDMLGMVTPGFGRLTDARVLAINNARERERSNLRSSLNKRRVLGSSFGDNALQRQAVGYAQEEERARAQSFLEELDLTQKLTSDQLKIDTANITATTDAAIKAFEAEAQANQVTIDEMNMFFQAASGMANTANQIAQQNAANAMQVAQMNAQGASGLGSALGNILGTVGGSVFGPIGSAIGGKIGGSLFGGGGSMLSSFGGGGAPGASSMMAGFSGMGI